MSELSREEAIIEEHRKAFILSGCLSDFHLNNLNNWILIVLNGIKVKNIKLNYDFGSQPGQVSEGSVDYILTLEKGEEVTEEQRTVIITHLRSWVKALFWEDTKVNIRIGSRGKNWN